MIIFSNSDNERRAFLLLSKFFRRGCQNCILRDPSKIFSGFDFPGWLLFSSMSEFDRNNFGHFLSFCRPCFGNRILHFMGNTVRTSYFLDKFFYLLTFWDTDLRVSGLLAKIFGQVLQNCILRVQRNLLRFFLKKLDVVNHIRTLSEYCSAYWLNFPNGPWKLLPTFREEHFTEFFFWIYIEILVRWSIKFPALRQKFLCRVCKAAF